MFLNKDNSIKWKLIAIVGGITVALCLAGIFWFDKPLFLFLRGFNWGIWGLFDTIFATKVWLAVSFIATLVIFFIKNKKIKFSFKSIKSDIKHLIKSFKTNPAFLVFCSVISASIVAGPLKFILGRARPVFYEALGQTGFFPLTTEWAFNSMPSGHTTASFAGLVMIGLLYPKIKAFTWTLAIVIGVSRVCYGAHFCSDVILGAFIGMVAADLVKNKFCGRLLA